MAGSVDVFFQLRVFFEASGELILSLLWVSETQAVWDFQLSSPPLRGGGNDAELPLSGVHQIVR